MSSILIEANLERAEIVGEIMMFFAGHLTTSSVLISLFHPSRGAPGGSRRGSAESHPTAVSSACAQETMRITRAAPILYREVADP